ncbi:hypothetical protein PG988_008805 [Apiospora saccharicola]
MTTTTTTALEYNQEFARYNLETPGTHTNTYTHNTKEAADAAANGVWAAAGSSPTHSEEGERERRGRDSWTKAGVIGTYVSPASIAAAGWPPDQFERERRIF